jgi:hypothetical protein
MTPGTLVVGRPQARKRGVVGSVLLCGAGDLQRARYQAVKTASPRWNAGGTEGTFGTMGSDISREPRAFAKLMGR